MAGETDPVEWLQENLIVDFPQNGEILSISLSGDELPEDLVRLVDAVAKAYKEEVVNDLRQRRLANRDLLARNLETLNKDIKRKIEEYLGHRQGNGQELGQRSRCGNRALAPRHFGAFTQKEELTTKSFDTQTDFMIMKGELDDPALIEAKVDEMLDKDLHVSDDEAAAGLSQHGADAGKQRQAATRGRTPSTARQVAAHAATNGCRTARMQREN